MINKKRLQDCFHYFDKKHQQCFYDVITTRSLIKIVLGRMMLTEKEFLSSNFKMTMQE